MAHQSVDPPEVNARELMAVMVPADRQESLTHYRPRTLPVGDTGPPKVQ